MLAELASRLPDRPRWVEARGMLLSGRCELVGPPGPGPGDFMVRGTDVGLLYVVGNVALAPLPAAVERSGARFVVCESEAVERVAAALPGWSAAPWVIHVPGGTPALSRPGQAAPSVRMLSLREEGLLESAPERLREELRAALFSSHVAAAFSGNRPVSFCYAIYETETLWDLAVETLEPARSRGFARSCCELLIDHMSRHGKEPVWGTLEENAASMGLARSLGFLPVDRLQVLRRTEGA